MWLTENELQQKEFPVDCELKWEIFSDIDPHFKIVQKECTHIRNYFGRNSEQTGELCVVTINLHQGVYHCYFTYNIIHGQWLMLETPPRSDEPELTSFLD